MIEMSTVRERASDPLRLRRRHRAERRFRAYGVVAIGLGALALLILLSTVFSRGFGAFRVTQLAVDVTFDPAILGVDVGGSLEDLQAANYHGAVRSALYEIFPEVTQRNEKRELARLLSPAAPDELCDYLVRHRDIFGEKRLIWLTASSDLDQLHKGNVLRELSEDERLVSDRQLGWYDQLLTEGAVRTAFNWKFFTGGDSRNPEQAGIGGAVLGSLFTLLVCFVLSFPIGVAAAVYLEEFAPKNRWTEFIEININNLAAVPSIIFGLLGLAIILNTFGFPRSTPLVGGTVLALMTLPTIIIACRAAIKAVPPSIRSAAMAVGASEMQVVLHHVLPLALPGTLTGTIIGLARALGETAPLLMIGMVAFVVDLPTDPLEPAAALPVQIYLWAESAERGFLEKTSAAIMLILCFLIVMNSAAVILRQRFERRW